MIGKNFKFRTYQKCPTWHTTVSQMVIHALSCTKKLGTPSKIHLYAQINAGTNFGALDQPVTIKMLSLLTNSPFPGLDLLV